MRNLIIFAFLLIGSYHMTFCQSQLSQTKGIHTASLDNTNQNTLSTPKDSTVPNKAPYMKQVEYSMIEEINLMRANPTNYIKFIEEYRAAKKNSSNSLPEATIDELILELKDTPTLSTLEPSECVYNAARNHGQDILKRGKSGHEGSDGSWPWDRVKRSCDDCKDGNENLVGGPASVRESIIILLIDHGIANRGHRRTLLNSHWTHVACYKIGQVGQMPNSWVQNFSQAKVSDTNSPSSDKPIDHNADQLSTKSGVPTQTKSTTIDQAASAPNASFMKSEENKMVEEINMMRANPTNYIKYIEEYRATKKNSSYNLPEATIDELISELRNTPTLSILEPSECVYNAARNHGQDILKRGKSGHEGSDGSLPWDRVKRSCNNCKDGNENLVGGPASVRESVIILLIDHGIANRGHRRTLLNPHWTHVACYKIGQVGQMPNSWVQNFGQQF